MFGFRLVRLGNTTVYLHPSLLALAMAAVASGYGPEFGVFLLSLFLHEAGHLLKASLEGAGVSKIHLWPFGAVATLERAWQLEPRAEAGIAAAGPLHNLGMAVLAWVVGRALPHGPFPGTPPPLIDLVVRTNLLMAGVNLLPCLPLDGGRIFRSWLSLRVGYVEASRVASHMGLAAGVVMTAWGTVRFFQGHTLDPAGFLGPVLAWGALAEREASSFHAVAKLLSRQEELKRRGILRVDHLVCRGDLRVKDVVVRFRPDRYHVITVVDAGLREMGRLTEGQVLQAYYTGEIFRRLDSLLDQ